MMEPKKRWTLVFTGPTFSTKAQLRKPATLEEAREIGKQDPVCKVLGGNMDFHGILGVDITNGDLRKMGYKITK